MKDMKRVLEFCTYIEDPDFYFSKRIVFFLLKTYPGSQRRALEFPASLLGTREVSP